MTIEDELRSNLAQALGMLDTTAIIMEGQYPRSSSLARDFTKKLKEKIGVSPEVQEAMRQVAIEVMGRQPENVVVELMRDRHGDAWLFEGDKARIVAQRGYPLSDPKHTSIRNADEIRKGYGPLTHFFYEMAK